MSPRFHLLKGLPVSSSQEKVIIDGDWGGDEMQLSAVLLDQPYRFQIIGAVSVFGNTSGQQTFTNGRNILHLLNADTVPVYRGADGPSDAPPQTGDNAHSANGVGGVVLPDSPAPIQTERGVDFIVRQLRDNPKDTITLVASGPCTDIAEAIRRDPAAMGHVKRIVIMGGCTADIPAADRPWRRGNITPDAEFNFFMAPADAQTVMQSGLPVVLLPMNCTQGLSLTPARQNAIRLAYRDRPEIAEKIIGMMSAPAALDRKKFNSDPFMHDVNCALYMSDPSLYETVRGRVTVSTDPATKGRTEFTPDKKGNVLVATRLKDSDRAFSIFLRGLEKAIPAQKPSPQHAQSAVPKRQSLGR